ncbi:MAG TPA: hypothetical protein VGH13_09780 [Xanthobacteraceae bacterium]|jgi:hypothetical protein
MLYLANAILWAQYAVIAVVAVIGAGYSLSRLLGDGTRVHQPKHAGWSFLHPAE